MKKPLFLALSALLLFTLILPTKAQETTTDCSPEAIAEWMIQRQLGRNRLQPLINGEVDMSIIEALLLLQDVRRNLEDLPRPECADELYSLTIYFYDALTDFYTFQLAEDNSSAESIINPRIQRYFDSIDEMYAALEIIADVDVMATANAIEPVSTPAPTQAPAEAITFSGESGGVVLGPVDVPTGVYRLILTGGANHSATLQPVSGSCIGTFIYVGSDGGSTEAIFRSENCRTLIQIAVSEEPWTLNLEPVE